MTKQILGALGILLIAAPFVSILGVVIVGTIREMQRDPSLAIAVYVVLASVCLIAGGVGLRFYAASEPTDEQYDSILNMVEDLSDDPKFVEEFRQRLATKLASDEWHYAAIVEKMLLKVREDVVALIDMLTDEYKEANPTETVVPDFIVMAHALKEIKKETVKSI